MPELPEVETLFRQLRQVITAERIAAVRIYDEKLLPFPELRGRRIREVRRVGKGVEIDLGGAVLRLHLRMSGRLLWRRSGDILLRHTRFSIAFDKGELLCIDPRRFATLTLHSGLPEATGRPLNLLAGMAPEEILARAGNRKLPVKALLLDQRLLPGMGNIYACEVLFETAVSPWRRACDVTPAEWGAIMCAIERILKEAVICRGTSISDWRDLFGKPGEYQHRLRVYDREGKTCLRCPGRIEWRKLSGRGTYYCPSCQK